MIRLATLADVPALVRMGERFRAESEYAGLLPDNPAQFATFARQLLANPDARIFVADETGTVVGMFAALIFQHPMSGARLATEFFWWVEPEHRGHGLALLRAAEAWATSAGATALQMIAPNKRIGALYRRLGFTEVETSYQRSLA